MSLEGRCVRSLQFLLTAHQGQVSREFGVTVTLCVLTLFLNSFCVRISQFNSFRIAVC